MKAREITKNNFGMPKIRKFSPFVPPNKEEAKQQIFRTIAHDSEMDLFIN